MPQKRHDAWGGYERLMPMGPDKKPIKGAKARAKCKKCGRIMHNIKRISLATHTKLCKGPQAEADKSSDSTTSEHSSILSNRDTLDNQSGSIDEDSNSSLSLPSTSRDTTSSATKLQRPIPKSRKINRVHHDSLTSYSSEMDDEEDVSNYASSISKSSTSTVANVARNVKQAPKKRRKSYESVNYEPLDDDKTVAVYKYYVVSNIEFDNVNLPATKELFSIFDPHFHLPSADDLRTTIAEKAAELVHVHIHTKLHTQVLQLLTRIVPGKIDDGKGNMIDWNKILALSLLRSGNGDWTYVKNLEFFANPTDDISNQIRDFCKDSVLEVKSTFDVDVLVLLHSGEYKLEDVCSIKLNDRESIKYYTLCEISTVLKQLHCDLISNRNNHREVTSYYSTLDKIADDIAENDTPMAVTIQRLFEAVDHLDEINQSIVSDKLAKIINPLHLATKVFQPEFHLSFLDKKVHKSLLALFQDFHEHTAPRILADCVPYYIEKSGGCFTRFFHEKRETNPENFWNASKLDPYLHNVKLLANYALQLLAIPSVLTNFNLKEAFKKLDKEAVKSVDFERVLFTYLLQQ